MVKNPDSINKVKDYLKSAGLNKLILSKMFFRDYSCPAGCGGCCPKFSLDYFEGSERWERFKKLYPEKLHFFKRREVDGVVIWSDLQEDNPNHHCKNLNMENGRCTIHDANPFTCEFELNKFVTYKKDSRAVLINRLFGRGWQLKKIDGTRGAMCQMLPFSFEKFLRDLKLLKELLWISKKLNIKSKLGYVIKYLDDNQESFKKNEGLNVDKVEFTGLNFIPKTEDGLSEVTAH